MKLIAWSIIHATVFALWFVLGIISNLLRAAHNPLNDALGDSRVFICLTFFITSYFWGGALDEYCRDEADEVEEDDEVEENNGVEQPGSSQGS